MGIEKLKISQPAKNLYKILKELSENGECQVSYSVLAEKVREQYSSDYTQQAVYNLMKVLRKSGAISVKMEMVDKFTPTVYKLNY